MAWHPKAVHSSSSLPSRAEKQVLRDGATKCRPQHHLRLLLCPAVIYASNWLESGSPSCLLLSLQTSSIPIATSTANPLLATNWRCVRQILLLLNHFWSQRGAGLSYTPFHSLRRHHLDISFSFAELCTVFFLIIRSAKKWSQKVKESQEVCNFKPVAKCGGQQKHVYLWV